MKIAVALLLLLVPAFAAEPSSKAEKEVLATLDTWKAAMLKGDAAELGKIYSPDLTYEHSSGKTENKTDAIQNAVSPTGLTKAITFLDPMVHVFGNTALVKSKADFIINNGTTMHLDTLMVFMKTPQGWQLVARQSTKLP